MLGLAVRLQPGLCMTGKVSVQEVHVGILVVCGAFPSFCTSMTPDCSSVMHSGTAAKWGSVLIIL